MDRIFIDSGAFIAWSSRRDIHHKVASEIYRALLTQHMPLVTTNLVVNETCTWLQRWAENGHGAAVRFGEYLRDVSAPGYTDEIPDAGLIVVYSTPEIERLAWDIFAKYDTAGFSFTDCVSFAVMQELKISRAFTFDKHFDVMGFERIVS